MTHHSIRLRGLVAALVVSCVLPAPGARAAGAAIDDLVLTTVERARLPLASARRRGPILLDYWATWCKPCLASLPEIQAIHASFAARGLTVVGISVDGPRNAARVRPFITRMGLTYPIVFDEDGRLQERFEVRGVPNAVLIDTTGKVVRRFTGYRPGEGAALAAAIEALLPAAAARADTLSAPGEPVAPADSTP